MRVQALAERTGRADALQPAGREALAMASTQSLHLATGTSPGDGNTSLSEHNRPIAPHGLPVSGYRSVTALHADPQTSIAAAAAGPSAGQASDPGASAVQTADLETSAAQAADPGACAAPQHAAAEGSAADLALAPGLDAGNGASNGEETAAAPAEAQGYMPGEWGEVQNGTRGGRPQVPGGSSVWEAVVACTGNWSS